MPCTESDIFGSKRSHTQRQTTHAHIFPHSFLRRGNTSTFEIYRREKHRKEPFFCPQTESLIRCEAAHARPAKNYCIFIFPFIHFHFLAACFSLRACMREYPEQPPAYKCVVRGNVKRHFSASSRIKYAVNMAIHHVFMAKMRNGGRSQMRHSVLSSAVGLMRRGAFVVLV